MQFACVSVVKIERYTRRLILPILLFSILVGGTGCALIRGKAQTPPVKLYMLEVAEGEDPQYRKKAVRHFNANTLLARKAPVGAPAFRVFESQDHPSCQHMIAIALVRTEHAATAAGDSGTKAYQLLQAAAREVGADTAVLIREHHGYSTDDRSSLLAEILTTVETSQIRAYLGRCSSTGEGDPEDRSMGEH